MLKRGLFLIAFAVFVIFATTDLTVVQGRTPKVHGTQATNILKGPYLLYPGKNTKMLVLWQTQSDAQCEISWGTDQTYQTGKAVTSEFDSDHQQKYLITGLTPGKKYYYRVTIGQSAYTGSFLAAPSSDAANVEFLAYGDTRTYPDRQNQVCGDIISTYSANPNCQTFILHTGDWVEKNTEEAWASTFFDRTYTNNISMQANLPIQGCVGNHEGSGTDYIKYWPYPYVRDHYWSFDYGPAHVAIIDQFTNYHRGSAQLLWLENDLRNSDKPWKFVVFHEPGWSAGSTHGNETEVRTTIEPLCEKYGVQIVFAGHNHYYARAVVNGVQHLTIGTGGAPSHVPKAEPHVVAFKGNTLGYCRISIYGNILTGQMLSSPGNTVIDTFTITRP